MEAWNEFHAGEIQPHVELDRLKIACDHLLAGLEKKPSRIDTDDVAAVATVAERIKRLIRDSDDRMTAKEIAALLPISVSTLRNKGLLRPFVADQSNGGRPTTYHYVQARPALQKHFGESLPDLLSAHRVISHRL